MSLQTLRVLTDRKTWDMFDWSQTATDWITDVPAANNSEAVLEPGMISLADWREAVYREIPDFWGREWECSILTRRQAHNSVRSCFSWHTSQNSHILTPRKGSSINKIRISPRRSSTITFRPWEQWYNEWQIPERFDLLWFLPFWIALFWPSFPIRGLFPCSCIYPQYPWAFWL